MTRIIALPLIDGPLTRLPRPRSEVVSEMACHLVKHNAWKNEADAMRVLLHMRYPSFEIVRYIDDVRQAAMQSVVAKEMAQP